MIRKSLLQALVCLMTIGLCSSCVKSPQLDAQDTGVAVESLAVQKAVALAWGDADPALILRKNDFAYIETDQAVQGYDPRLVTQSGITVSDRSISSDQKLVHHRVLFQLAEIDSSGGSKTSTTAEDFDVENTLSVPTPAPTLAAVSSKSLSAAALTSDFVKTLVSAADGSGQVRQHALSIDVAANLFQICALQTPANVVLQCFNLVTSSEVRPAPDLVAAQPNCGGLPGCQMHVNNVAFDVLLTTTKPDGVSTQKIKFISSISPDVPYFARVLDYCTLGLVDVPSMGQKVLVKVCDHLKNFNYGDPDHF